MKKTTTLILFAFIFTSCHLNTCPDKESYMKSISELGESTQEKNTDNIKELEDLYEMLTTECYPKFADELNLNDKKEVWKKVLVYQYKSNGKDFSEAIDSTIALFESDEDFNSSVILKEFKGDAKELINDLFSEDLNKVIDNVLEDVNELGDKLKEMLEDEKDK